MGKTILNFILKLSRQCPRTKKKLLLESNSKGTIFSYRLGGMGEGEGEFLRSHGFRSKGDYRKLTAIRGGTVIISQSLGWGGRGVKQ